MARSTVLTWVAYRIARGRLRRLAGTRGLGWAVRVPLVTIAVAGVLLLVLRPRD